MSGGTFQYKQHVISDISNDIATILLTREINDCGYKLENVETICAMCEIKERLDNISKDIHALDWMLAGDTNEEIFLEEIAANKAAI